MNSIKRKDKPVTKEKDKKKPTLKKYKKTFLILFYQDLTKLSSVKSNKEQTNKKKKNIVYNKASKLYNELLRRYFNEYKNFCSSKQLSLDMIRKIYLLNIIIIVIGLKKTN